ncbi:MAG TPA: DNA-binding response regulator [Cytophagales bacterium]|nr:DNA-binding response regulator [Cytophagales bacterium]
MRVLIVEDEQLAAERLGNLIRNYDSGIEILGPLDTVEEAAETLKRADLDIVFLDIQLADGKSFEIFDQVNYTRPVIFTTAYDQYALWAFKLNSIDYLLKPIRPEELHGALDKFKRLAPASPAPSLSPEVLRELIRSIRPAYKTRFVVKQGSKLFSKPVGEVAYFFADGKLTFLVGLDTRPYLVDHTLEELECTLLDPHEFFRISRKHLVRISSVNEVKMAEGKAVVRVLGADSPLPISRERVTEFKAWLNQ